MDWLDRYVSAVKRGLPSSLREGVGEELHALLDEEVEEEQERDGGTLTEEALLGVLRRHGHPLLVASRHRGRRVLIGEAVYPVYTAALRWLAVVVFFLYIAYVVVSDLLGATGERFVLGELCSLYLIAFALATLVFHLADRWIEGFEVFERWDPRTLPPVEGATSLAGPAVALRCIAAWMAFLGAIDFERSIDLFAGRSGARIHTFVMWLQVHGSLSLALHGWLLFRPYWTLEKRAAEGAIALFLSAGAMRCAKLDGATDFLVFGDRYMVSHIVDRTFWVVAVAAFIAAAFSLYQVVKAMQRRRRAVGPALV